MKKDQKLSASEMKDRLKAFIDFQEERAGHHGLGDAFPSAGVLLETCDRGITCLAAYSSGADCLANVSPVNTVVRL